MLDAIYNNINGNMVSVWQRYNDVSALVIGPLQAGMAINLILVGFGIMRGLINEPLGVYLSTWFRAQLVILAATSSFGPWLGSVAWGLPEKLTMVFGGNPIGGQFDGFVASVGNAAWATAEAADSWPVDIGVGAFEIPDLLAWLLAVIVWGTAFLAGALAMVTALYTKFALAVVVAVGPLFVASLMFNSSSGMFFSWFGAAMNAAINAAAVAAALVFVQSAVWDFAATAQADKGPLAIYGLLIAQAVIVLIGATLIQQAGSIASFAGGGGASGSGLVSAALPSNTMRQLGNAARSRMGSAASGGAKSAARGVASGARQVMSIVRR
jgi:type IV secretion system protein VirB6